MTILLIVVGVTLLISANCSLYESVLYSTRVSALEASRKKNRHSTLAKRLIHMKAQISKPIAAILILNTIANTAGATIAGMYAAQELGVKNVPVFSIAFTLAILFIAEILPKTLGVVYWRKCWPFIVWPLLVLDFLLKPFIWLVQKFINMFTGKDNAPTITEDEILALVSIGAKEGEITHEEGKMVRNIIYLENKKVASVMTPRQMIFHLDAKIPIKDARRIVAEREFSRIPIYDDTPENMIGYVMIHDLNLAKNLENPDQPIRDIARPLKFVEENTNCLSLLKSFLKRRNHIAIVHDDFGGVSGLVTLEDLLESVLGTEIVDETDRVVDLRKELQKNEEK